MTQLRVARHTERLDEVVGFHRDSIGLIKTGGFRDHGGYVQLVDGGANRSEIKNMAVDEAYQGRGIGRALIGAAVERARARHAGTLVVATAAADAGNLRFYQRSGFRMRSIERDAFTPDTGYPAGTILDGIALRDRVWLDLELGDPDRRRRG